MSHQHNKLITFNYHFQQLYVFNNYFYNYCYYRYYYCYIELYLQTTHRFVSANMYTRMIITSMAANDRIDSVWLPRSFATCDSRIMASSLTSIRGWWWRGTGLTTGHKTEKKRPARSAIIGDIILWPLNNRHCIPLVDRQVLLKFVSSIAFVSLLLSSVHRQQRP